MNGIFPEFDRAVLGVDACSVSGYAIARNLPALDRMATELGVPPLSTFIDGRTMMEEILGPDDEMPENVPPVQWLETEAGLSLVSALLDHLTAPNSELSNHSMVVSDLRVLEEVLRAAVPVSARFHLLFDL